MALFRTIIHPTDFDGPSKEAFRLARSLAQALGARVVVLHVVPPPAIVAQDGRIIRDPTIPEPIDLWPAYRRLQVGTPDVAVEYAVVVGEKAEAKHLLAAKARELGDGVLVVMGSHGRSGLSKLLWGSKVEEVIRDVPCPVLVVKAPSRAAVPLPSAAATTVSP